MPAPRMIRCINGHVFDGNAMDACPDCGWTERRQANDAVNLPPRPIPPDRRVILITASGLLVAGIGAGTYAWFGRQQQKAPEPERRQPEPRREAAAKRDAPVETKPKGSPPFTDLQPLRPDEQISAAAALKLSVFATDTALLTRALRLSERQPMELDPKRLLVSFVRNNQPLALAEAAAASYSGYAVAPNDQVALDFATRAADQGAVRGRTLLAQMRLAGRAVPRDPTAAGDLLLLAAKADSLGSPQALTGLTALKRKVEGTGPTSADLARAVSAGNWDIVVTTARALADLKIAAGYNALGERHWAGVGLEKNTPAAIEWFQKAVAIGYANAAFNLSVIARSPPNGTSNLPESMVWLQIALLQSEDKPRILYFTEKISAQAGLLDRAQWQAVKTLFAGLALPGAN